MATLKERISEDMKNAMRAKDSARLGALRLLLAAIKQREVDDRKPQSDDDIVNIIDKMLKQRRDSVSQFEKGGRQDLVDAENFEISVLQTYMPQALSENEIGVLVAAAIGESGASGPQDMGKVMAVLKPKLAGRADMTKVSQLVKSKLSDPA